MSVALHSRVRFPAILPVILCSILADARTAVAQFPTRAFPAVPAATTHRHNFPLRQIVRYVPDPAGHQSAGYWIASSLCCPQSVRTVNGCLPQIFEAQPGSKTFPSSMLRLKSTLAPGDPVCIVVHGSYMVPADFVTENPAVNRWLNSAVPGRPLHVIFYRWPSESGFMIVPQINVAVLGLRAEFNGYYLARLIAAIPAENPVCLVGHSHGARATVSALHLLGGGRVQGLALSPQFAAPRRLRAVLLAAAVDHHWLNGGQRFGRALHVVERLVNVVNRDDILLQIYPMKEAFGVPALGQTGLLPGDRRMLGTLSNKAREIDVTPLVGAAHMMPNYFRRPEIANVIAPHVFFDDTIKRLQYVQHRRRRPVRRSPQRLRTTR